MFDTARARAFSVALEIASERPIYLESALKTHLSFGSITVQTRDPHPVAPALAMILLAGFKRHVERRRWRVCSVTYHGLLRMSGETTELKTKSNEAIYDPAGHQQRNALCLWKADCSLFTQAVPLSRYECIERRKRSDASRSPGICMG